MSSSKRTPTEDWLWSSPRSRLTNSLDSCHTDLSMEGTFTSIEWRADSSLGESKPIVKSSTFSAPLFCWERESTIAFGWVEFIGPEIHEKLFGNEDGSREFKFSSPWGGERTAKKPLAAMMLLSHEDLNVPYLYFHYAGLQSASAVHNRWLAKITWISYNSRFGAQNQC